jgi:hypothetical protein
VRRLRFLTTGRRRKRAIFVAYLLALTGTAYYGHYRVWIARLSDVYRAHAWDFLVGGSDLDIAVGGVHQHVQKNSRFSRFSQAKPEGQIRIGCFGDSWTAGEEANPNGDFPSHLAHLMREGKNPPVDVLNFGNGGHGFHQAFRLWEELAPAYGIDIVLLGPDCFQPQRDWTFQSDDSLGLHGRYVLAGEGLRWIEPLNPNDDNRFHRYFRFVPRLRYLRYDARLPAFLRHLDVRNRFPYANPFYYRDDAEKEIRETWRRMIRRMADQSSLVILIHHDKDLVRMARGLAPNVYAAEFQIPKFFPYAMPKNHTNSAGYSLIAEIYHDALRGKDRSAPLVVRETSDFPPPVDLRAELPFDRLSGAELRFAGTPAARLRAPDEAIPGDFASGATSLLFLKGFGRSMTERPVLPVRRTLRNGDTALLVNGGRVIERLAVRRIIGNLFEVSSSHDLFPPFEQGMPSAELKAAGIDVRRPTVLRFDDDVLVRFHTVPQDEKTVKWRIASTAGSFAVFVPEEGLRLNALPEEGEVSLVLQDQEGRIRRFPVGRYKKTAWEVSFPGIENVHGTLNPRRGGTRPGRQI